MRQLHLTFHLLRSRATEYDAFFVDQLSTCVPFIRTFAKKRIVYYCHFPDKLLANGEFVQGRVRRKGGLLKRLYRMPMDWLEEITTGSQDNETVLGKEALTVFQGMPTFCSQTPNSQLKYSIPSSEYPGNHTSCIRASTFPHTHLHRVCRPQSYKS